MAIFFFLCNTTLLRLFFFFYQVVYILDQVRALEEELLHKIELQGLDVKPQILVVCHWVLTKNTIKELSLKRKSHHI